MSENFENNDIANYNEANETYTQNVQNTQNTENTNQNLILGKFKDVDELTNAYKNIQTQHGQQSKELGELRKKNQMYEEFQKNFQENIDRYNSANEYLKNVVSQYNKEEYFQNPEFSTLYQEAFNTLGTKLDTQKFIGLLDKFAQARINLHEKSKLAKSENESIKNQMQFSKSDSKFAPSHLPKIDSLSDAEIDAFVAKYI